MAIYFHGPNDIQRQALYLMNPSFTDAPPSVAANMLCLNQQLQGVPFQSYPHPIQQPLSLSLPMPEIANQSSVINGAGNCLTNCKYLKFAQQLLDEVVSVGKVIGVEAAKEGGDKSQVSKSECEENTLESSVQLTAAERQELQMKKAKLVNLLDEVRQKYRQYRQQMQLVASTFESAAGTGSSQTYIAVALWTISKQFRCLRDAITGQIRVVAKNLGEEEEELTESKGSCSRLWFMDQQMRQQKALQQLGMTTPLHTAWRPQRGLPERSVLVLRAWLFENFLHPYPKDSDKLMLAKQTGLTRSQVSNWFINARVRLWKPMVEEMYMEEMKDEDANVNGNSSSKSDVHRDNSPTTTQQLSPQLTSMPVLPASIQGSANRESEHHAYHLVPGMVSSHGGGFGEYSNGEVERFGIEQFAPKLLGSNGVSLTLKLNHYDGPSLSGGAPQPFLVNSNGYSGLGDGPSVAYENMSMESRKRFDWMPNCYHTL